MADFCLKAHFLFLPWKKSNCVLSKAKTKASVQSAYSILKYSPFEPVGSYEEVLVPIQVA